MVFVVSLMCFKQITRKLWIMCIYKSRW
jgi:hypothetical protein